MKLKMFATRHVPSGESNVFIHSLPRSGSSWLMELILTQPGFASCNEPLNLDKPAIRDHLGISDWPELHNSANKERIFSYLNGFCSGQLRDSRFNRPAPFSEFYRPVTRRTVFKIISGGVEYINPLAEAFNGRVVLLLRHPIPVSLSRKRLPKTASMLNTDFARFFAPPQLALAERVINSQSKFALGVLDWCLHYSVALRARQDEWTVVTYEQLVLDAKPVVDLLATRLDLPRADRMSARLSVPSRSTEQSDAGTQQVLKADRDEKQQKWLVEKWLRDVDQESCAIANELLEGFQLADVYSATDALPQDAYWIQ